ncbi:hypothetical protein ABEW34_04115 [Paenibacillus algorifonticola]|uniref:hypothetical protein n=1 Tax=Paenibacillus algorifonticola TaxID=684063 RepID=UPI003D294E62
MYIGNGAYCYANATAMLLQECGESFLPATIEVLSGVGLDASIEGGNLFFLSNCATSPDSGISRAMKVLGFSVKERASEEHGAWPIVELRQALLERTVLLGPLDMGYLQYVPNSRYLHGVDHFVLAYAIDEEYVYVHDPAGYPYSRLPLELLQKAWQASTIGYRTNSYRCWHSPERVASPSQEEIYADTISFFQGLYRSTGPIGQRIGIVTGQAAFRQLRETLESGQIPEALQGHLTHFVFQLGARRANDFSAYFAKEHPLLSELKQKQASLLGLCHGLTVQQNWAALSPAVKELSELEAAFSEALLAI